MRLETIEIENSRGIQHLKLAFQDELERVQEVVPTVGPNSSGKTALLDAITCCLGPGSEIGAGNQICFTTHSMHLRDLIRRTVFHCPGDFSGVVRANEGEWARATEVGALPEGGEGVKGRVSRPHKQCHSRGYLPHRDTPGLLQAITFRLADSLPKGALERIAAESDEVERRKQLDAWVDRGLGECWLGRSEIAVIVEDSLLHFDGQRYRLLAWCVMLNHVHVVVETMKGYPVGELVHSWKSHTAKLINKRIGRNGPVWQADYFDRYIRDQQHLTAAIGYVEANPVKAGLVERQSDWRFSSAFRPKPKKSCGADCRL